MNATTNPNFKNNQANIKNNRSLINGSQKFDNKFQSYNRNQTGPSQARVLPNVRKNIQQQSILIPVDFQMAPIVQKEVKNVNASVSTNQPNTPLDLDTQPKAQ